MSQMLEKKTPVEHVVPPLVRSRAIDYTLLVIGALVAAFGLYTFLAPASWWLADLAEGWYLGSFVVGGVILSAGFGFLGAGMRDQDGIWTARAVTSMLLAALALAGAVTFAVIWIL
jgi:hypothetical protein